LIDRGIDPNDDRADKDMARETAKAEEQRRQRLTRDVWDQYVKERAPQWSQETLSKHQRAGAKGGESRKNSKLLTVAGPLTALLDLRLADLSAKRVAKWLQTERVKRSGATLLAFSHLRAFLRWVGEQEEYAGIVDPGVCEARLVRDAKPEARARNDCLQREQLKAWFAAVRMQHPIISAYLQCLLLTGARRSEMAELKWADVDLVWRTVTISGKTGARTIPLPPYCASLISALPRYSEYVFASQRGKEKRVVAPHNPHSRVLALAGISGLTVHGLRRSFATLAEWADPPAGVIAQIMGHAASATAEKHYKVRSVDFLRLWHERIEKWFLGEANISFTPPAAEGKRLQLVSEVAA
jgi:integrase